MQRVVTSQVSKLSKLYVWSVALEPLLFFIVSLHQDNQGIGVGEKVSRFLQLGVLIGLGLRLLSHPRWVRIPNPFHPFYRTYSYYYILTCLVGLCSIFSGAYSLNHEIDIANRDSFLPQVVDGILIRPFFEYFIALYYFFYFIMLPRYLLPNAASVDYFFKIFGRLFLLSFLIGVLELFAQYSMGLSLVGRHFYDGRDLGNRFHGLAGEPRDAFVYLILGLSLLALKDIWKNKKQLSLWQVILITIAALLTQSASGLFGLVFAFLLIMIFYIPTASLKEKAFGFFILGFIAITIVISVNYSTRITAYFEAFFELYDTLKANEEVTSVLANSMNNIYPIWKRWQELAEYDFLPLLVGSGFGSAAVVHANFVGELANPNSSLIRSIYETGIFGTYLFILSFLIPIKKISISEPIYRKILFFMLLLLGAFFGHRTSAPFIFLGITLIVLRYIQQRELSQQTASPPCLRLSLA